MMTRLALLVALLAAPAVASATASTTTYSSSTGRWIATCPAVASSAACTLDCTHSPVQIACSDADGCAWTLSETHSYFDPVNGVATARAFQSNDECVVQVSTATGANTFADSSGVQEIDGDGTLTIPLYARQRFIYGSARWSAMKATGDVPTFASGTITGALGTGSLTVTGATLYGTAAPNGDTILTTASCGTDQFVGAAGDDFTLPAPTAGCRIRFIVDANFATTSMTIVTASSANVILGAIDVNSTLVGCAGVDTVTVVNTAELKGDWVEFRSDGTSWFVSGMGVTAGAFTCTTAS